MMRIATCRLKSKASNTIQIRKLLMSLRLAVRHYGAGGIKEAFLLVGSIERAKCCSRRRKSRRSASSLTTWNRLSLGAARYGNWGCSVEGPDRRNHDGKIAKGGGAAKRWTRF